jgi:quercetin dioxygenase-like cupin family protein
MIIRHSSKVPAEAIESGGDGATIRELITVREGAPNFAMRLFEVAPGGFTPMHSHPWEHEVFVVEGAGSLGSDAGPVGFCAGDSIFIPSDERHQFRNAGDTVLRFICIIPV